MTRNPRFYGRPADDFDEAWAALVDDFVNWMEAELGPPPVFDDPPESRPMSCRDAAAPSPQKGTPS